MGATVKAGTQERGTEHGTEVRCQVRWKKYAMMNTHAHIVKAHMVISALVKSTCLVCRFRRNSQVCLSVCQFRTLIDLTPSDSGSDSDFIEATYHFCTYHIRFCTSSFYYIQVLATTEIILLDSCVKHCSLTKSCRLICIARSWEFRFVMLTSVRTKQFTGSSAKTSRCFSRIGC